MMGECEANYVRFVRLLPTLDEQEDWVFGVEPVRQGELSQVIIEVIERSKYTTTLSITQNSMMTDWVPDSSIKVRLYHDARMAEVLTYQRRRVRQSYDYPNQHMHQKDEKAQLNSFLGEWLDFCLKSGCACHFSDDLTLQYPDKS